MKRRLLLVFALVACVIAGAWAVSRVNTQRVRCSRLELTGPDGKTMFVLSARENNLEISDASNKCIARISKAFGGSMYGLELMSPSAKQAPLVLAASANGAGIVVYDAARRERIVIGLDKDKSQITIKDSAGQVKAVLP